MSRRVSSIFSYKTKVGRKRWHDLVYERKEIIFADFVYWFMPDGNCLDWGYVFRCPISLIKDIGPTTSRLSHGERVGIVCSGEVGNFYR